MPSSLNLSLTDELREFVDQNCGDGTMYATPSELSAIYSDKRRCNLKPRG